MKCLRYSLNSISLPTFFRGDVIPLRRQSTKQTTGLHVHERVFENRRTNSIGPQGMGGCYLTRERLAKEDRSSIAMWTTDGTLLGSG